MTALKKYFQEKSSNSPREGSMALPGGEYVICAHDITERENDSGAVYLEIKFKIMGPSEFADRLFWQKYHMVNKSQTCIDYSRESLRQLSMCALGREADHSKELLDKPFYGVLKVEFGKKKPDGGTWEDSNQIIKYRAITGTMPPKELPSVQFRQDIELNDELPF